MLRSALLIAAAAQFVDRRRRAVAEPWILSFSDVDARLLCGAALFGVGWGLAGFCPGPALAALVTGSGGVALFVLAMLVGMGLFHVLAEPSIDRSAAEVGS